MDTNNTPEIITRKEYKFKCGIEAAQEELTYKQGMSLMKRVFTKTGVPNFNKNMTELALLNTILAGDYILEIVDEILIDVKLPEVQAKPDWSKLTMNELAEVMADFFYFQHVAEELVKDWKKSSGFCIDLSGEEIQEFLIDKKVDARFYFDYWEFQKFIKGKTPGYIKGTETELDIELCKELNLKPGEWMNLKPSFLQIYMLSIEKKSFLTWYGLPKDKSKTPAK